MAARDTLFAPDIYNVFDKLRAEGDEAKLAAFDAARRKAMTDDQERFEILRGLMPKDNEGTIQLPPDSVHAAPFNGWPTREDQIQFPTTAAVLGSLKYTDSKDEKGNVTKTAQAKFIEDYLKKPKALAKELEKGNKGFGVKSADILKQAFRESLKDEEERQTQQAREDILNGNTDWNWSEQPWFKGLALNPDKILPPKLQSLFLDAFMSKQKDAYMRGEDPSIGDYAADIGGNALMFVPGTGFVKTASKIPGVGHAAARAADFAISKAPRVAPKVVGIGKSVGGNAVAPFATEGLQYVGDAIDSDRDANFNSSRAILGTLTNVGVNDVLARMGGKLFKTTLDKEAASAANKELRETLKGASKYNTDKVFKDAINQDHLQAYVVNKLGGDRAADFGATSLGVAPPIVKDLRENAKEVNDARYPKAPLPTDIDETDTKYIKQIIDNPKKIYESNDTDFKMWFATRGNELLRGTEYHVPTWEVKF